MSADDVSYTTVAIVTGAASGIGAEIARSLAAEGTAVGLLDLDEEGLQRVASTVAEHGVDVVTQRCDVGSLDNVTKAVQITREKLGPISILVNVAGWSPNMPFAETTPDVWQQVIAVNYTGVLNSCQAVLDEMTSRGYGRIVSVASDAARVGTPREAVYAGAKAAVIAFSKALAAEVAKDAVTVNVVSPGTTDTPLLRALLTHEQLERRTRANPMRRIGRPEDVAGAVRYFISPAAGYVTGQVLSVNGGITRVD